VDQKGDLDRQVIWWLTVWATGGGYGSRPGSERSRIGVHTTRRKKFLTLPRDPSVSAIVVEHRDRFVRFGLGRLSARKAAKWPRSPNKIAKQDRQTRSPNKTAKQDRTHLATV
jgi:predicted site-specific integrase-resolvase